MGALQDRCDCEYKHAKWLEVLLTLLEPQSRFWDKPVKLQVVFTQNGTAVLKDPRQSQIIDHRSALRPATSALPAADKGPNLLSSIAGLRGHVRARSRCCVPCFFSQRIAQDSPLRTLMTLFILRKKRTAQPPPAFCSALRKHKQGLYTTAVHVYMRYRDLRRHVKQANTCAVKGV